MASGYHSAMPANYDVWSGAMQTTTTTNTYTKGTQGTGYLGYIRLNASKYNAIYGSSDTVQPPALSAKYLIKY